MPSVDLAGALEAVEAGALPAVNAGVGVPVRRHVRDGHRFQVAVDTLSSKSGHVGIDIVDAESGPQDLDSYKSALLFCTE